MKILITGINGLVGSFVAKKMIAQGHEVFGLSRENADLSLIDSIKSDITLEIVDILDLPNLEKAIESKDWVIHCAGLVSFAPKDRAKLYKINVEGTANIVNLCLEKGTKKLLFISSVAALGRQIKKTNKQQEIITEANDWVESPENSNYAKSKYLAELEVWRGVSEGLNAVIVNPSNILGEGDWNKTSTKLFKYVYDENLFYTDGTLNYVDVQDVANIINLLMNSTISNERFIISAGNIDQIKFFKEIAQYFLKKAPIYKLNPFFIEILWRIEAIKAKILGTEPLITKETSKSAKTKIEYDSTKIKTAIKFEFTPLNTTLQRVCAGLLSKKNKTNNFS